MRYIKLFEDFNDYVPMDEINLQFKTGIQDNIEIAVAICEEQNIDYEPIIEEIFNLSWFDKYCRLKGNTITEKLIYLLNLTKLDLGSNNLKELPKEIGYLTNLTYLDLSYNDLKELPKEIGNFTNLTKLDLSFNNITKLPKEIGYLSKLIKLDLYKNNLTELPTEIANLTKLTFLHLDNNPLNQPIFNWLDTLNIKLCKY